MLWPALLAQRVWDQPWNDEQPIRAELFGLERFRAHAASLAQSQEITREPRSVVTVVDRTHDNGKVLLRCCKRLSDAAAAGQTVTPEAEWLIDNYYLIEEHIRQALDDLPSTYYKQLPKIATGPLAGHPQIFGIAWAFIAHTDSRFDASQFIEFINAYQNVRPLTIGELWAAAISLRLVLIENLRRISAQTVALMDMRELADARVDSLLDGSNSIAGFSAIFDAGTYGPAEQLSFAVQVIRRLRDQEAADPGFINWLRGRVQALGHDFDSAVTAEHHRQATAAVTMQNLITSLRFIADYHWEDWFDQVSLVDRLLRTSSQYADMDFQTRNAYRNGIEDLPRHANGDELEITARVIEAAKSPPADAPAAAASAGYYIVGPGRRTIETRIGYRPPLNKRIAGFIRGAGLPGYLGLAALFALVILWFGLSPLLHHGIAWPLVLVLGLLGFFIALEAAIAMVNYAVTQLLRPVVLPGLELPEGPTPEMRTLVVIPALLLSHDAVEELCGQLEVHYLANPRGDVFFALASDWKDASAETAEGDEALLSAALDRIAALNALHGGDRFLLLHRSRQWNASEGVWMGWERKRGKLHELNRLLRGAVDTSFMVIGGRLPANVRYVLTLDADTQLPRDAVRRMVGKIAHPLNQPHVDEALGRVTTGYGILQPRITPSLPVGHAGSLFQRLYSSHRGIDPYVFAVSDVYQDLFGEGSFAGKGIYDVDIFEKVMAGRIPENSILSHDLFEGNFARAALVTDVEVVEAYPERYAVHASRQHRWTRGDWQLLPWIFGRRRGEPRGPSALGLWKMIDNLRRSLLPAMMLLALFIGWLLLPDKRPAVWTSFVLLTAFIPVFLPLFGGSSLRRVPVTLASQARVILQDVAQAVLTTASNIVLLAHQAMLNADAILRTLYRLAVSRRHMLEWTTAAQAQANSARTLPGTFILMWASVVVGLLALVIAGVRGGSISLTAAGFGLVWLLAPVFAYFMSKHEALRDELAAAPEDRMTLRTTARRTWRFFDAFVGAEDNFLPPDNFQEDPAPVVAHRTSPTNIGLYLLSVASAREFGWISLAQAANRIAQTVTTLHKMEKVNGHLLNWYATTTLAPLEPRYVSSVDSGNLAGHLIAVSNFCRIWARHPVASASRLDGIRDVLAILIEEMVGQGKGNRDLKGRLKDVEQKLAAFGAAVKAAQEAPELLAARLIGLAVQAGGIADGVTAVVRDDTSAQAATIRYWAQALREAVEQQFLDATVEEGHAAHLRDQLLHLADETAALALAMKFDFLSDPRRNLMAIGYRVTEAALDESCYDLLASEAALASFLAIAKGDLPARHWFRLGRTVTEVEGRAALLSWSGSMFEYLMPALVLSPPSGSLIDQTIRLVVKRQISYGAQVGVPWGISESAFSARDRNLTYQYSNFGVPGLGLKRGLAANVVVAPYATGLAAMVMPVEAAANYRALEAVGARGNYGYVESIDYTPSRLREGQSHAVVKAYFAHHQGMTITAILNAVSGNVIRTAFHEESIVRAAELLLQERAPDEVPLTLAGIANTPADIRTELAAAAPKPVDPRGGGSLDVQFLSNGQMTSMVTATGTGSLSWRGLSVMRWREDAVLDPWGQFVFLRDVRTGEQWPAGYSPRIREPSSYEAELAEHKVTIRRQDGDFATLMECVVSTESDAEARRISVTNTAAGSRVIEITTYAELALAQPAADMAHPAFSKMFIQTEFNAELGALIAMRRRRETNDPEIWVAQFLLPAGHGSRSMEFETSRAAFLGRGNTLATADALKPKSKLSGTQGTVLDPVFALRHRMRVEPGHQACWTLWTLVAESRESVLNLVDMHRQQQAFERAGVLAWTHARVQLRHFAIEGPEAEVFRKLSNLIVYASPAARPSPQTLVQQMRDQTKLWAAGISGTRPILLVRIDALEDIDIIRQVLKAAGYWAAKRMAVDLVILNEKSSSYIQDLQGAIEDLVRKSQSAAGGGDATSQVFALRADLLPPDTLAMLPAVARVTLHARAGNLARQVARMQIAPGAQPPASLTALPAAAGKPTESVVARADLLFFNGFGGFDPRTNEYVILHQAEQPLPAPWINVIANAEFGTQCSAEGGGYTWFGNSREFQITPWSNDPVSDPPAEVFYVKDLSNGQVMSPCVQPKGLARGTFRTRHGFGYTIHEAEVGDVSLELCIFVPVSGAAKISRLRIRSSSPQSRSFAVTAFADLVLGPSRSISAFHVATEVDAETGALMARNPWSQDSAARTVFADMMGRQGTMSADRRAFLGAYGRLDTPAALLSPQGLNGKTGAGLDPCFALQQTVAVSAAARAEVTLVLGAGETAAAARAAVTQYRAADLDGLLAEVRSFWRDTVGKVQVETPDAATNVVLNGWLLYQALSCRMWGRAGAYQASGAFGFRDQLQDTMALAVAQPSIARAHILKAASRQFPEGDVQHWWLPGTGTGTRTRISDDPVWLAYCTLHYISVTGDRAILDEEVTFIEGRELEEHEHDAFYPPVVSDQRTTLYEHCCRGLMRSLTRGSHGLPLMGTGDWNDGFNRVGEKGKGESVWLAWFIIATLTRFTALSEARGDSERVGTWQKAVTSLTAALEEHAWDGAWYRRAFFDDGSPLGSKDNAECRIDAIAQSWAVLSGVAPPERARAALESAWTHLVKTDDSLALLFTPPFDVSQPDPGYVRSYPPGLRENGGQYSHGAIWSVFAHAQLGEAERAFQLFSILNPVNHARTVDEVNRYKAEPYVVAADIYSVPPHVGRAGWTWYTGAAGWLYRAGIEAILGITWEQGHVVRIAPCVPASWPGFTVTLQHDGQAYTFRLVRDAADPADARVEAAAGGWRVTLRDGGEITLPLR